MNRRPASASDVSRATSSSPREARRATPSHPEVKHTHLFVRTAKPRQRFLAPNDTFKNAVE